MGVDQLDPGRGQLVARLLERRLAAPAEGVDDQHRPFRKRIGHCRLNARERLSFRRASSARARDMVTPSFPAMRMRRGRSAPWIRDMLAEHRLHPSDLIWPLFICEGEGQEEPISTLPGVSRWSVDRLADKAREARDLGIPCIALFPNTPPNLRTDDAREALNPDNLICRAIKAIKDAVPEVGVLTDVALDPYTAHGHDGLTDDQGRVLNDETVAVLVQQALVQAMAGADIVAPSDMMDGRVGAIRAGAGEGRLPSTSRSWPMPPNMPRPSTARSATRSARAAC